MNLYAITLTSRHTCYVIATDPTSAYTALRSELDKMQWGLSSDKKLHSIELVAAQDERPSSNKFLFGV